MHIILLLVILYAVKFSIYSKIALSIYVLYYESMLTVSLYLQNDVIKFELYTLI